ncbi:hypothetical protein ACPA54_19885 [Uniformispora flossi]|uniref:hypothetical protein n=1 Tax=Uniformispora flossi TaxID=3390723 RepID=UPI003C301571
MGLRKTTAITAALGLLVGAGAAAGTAAALWPGAAKDTVPYVYEGDKVVDSAPVKSAFLEVRVTAYHCGLAYITGTHAEYYAHGQLCRVGVRLDNQQLVTANIDSRIQKIVLADGTELIPDDIPMQIKRQEQVQQMGARNIVVLSYWFDIPADAVPVAVRIRATPEAPPAEIRLPKATWDRQ